MEKMCHPMAVTLFDSKEDPIDNFGAHELSLLDSALNNPQRALADGTELYPTLEKKAAILYYSLIKNHPFRNGNKRTATAAMMVFILINGKWFKNEYQKEIENYLVDLAVKVAGSVGSADKDILLNEIEEWLKLNIGHVHQG